eukprot:3090123-Prymnesium_polylepis.1
MTDFPRHRSPPRGTRLLPRTPTAQVHTPTRGSVSRNVRSLAPAVWYYSAKHTRTPSTQVPIMRAVGPT